MQCGLSELLTIRNLIALKGNHDEWFNKFILTGYHPDAWIRGGAPTSRSYLRRLGKEKMMLRTSTGYKTALNPGDIPEEHRLFFHRYRGGRFGASYYYGRQVEEILAIRSGTYAIFLAGTNPEPFRPRLPHQHPRNLQCLNISLIFSKKVSFFRRLTSIPTPLLRITSPPSPRRYSRT